MTGSGSFVIVVGFDGSENSRHALKWAVDEAKLRDGQLRLITVWSKPPLAWYPALLETAVGDKKVTEDSPQQVAETIQAAALKTAEDEGVTATGQVVHSDSAASAVLDAATAADLVVVGSRGHGGFPGLHLGSVSTQVSSHAPCPVLVVHPKES
ncbi:nucleotide-binding universal stress UspA family protein [Arthrobacter ginsengisoli]|uniref:Nucleotide-binding universal stress UspA family protein n=1 Tax=Arthrobacter ginsengisoli TaxID=1356565 RepID=A0ABU1U755_9MICC|nr:universal stress protein [Arthrobacter ginsengisoli]MDR7081001.1 nucleotide-binding universal stress UspA family protein [Arthrobacter ginsengisoli]